MVCNFFQIIKNTDLRSEKNGKEKKKGGNKRRKKGKQEGSEGEQRKTQSEKQGGRVREGKQILSNVSIFFSL